MPPTLASPGVQGMNCSVLRQMPIFHARAISFQPVIERNGASRSRCRLGSAPPRPPAGQRGAPHVPAGSILPGHLFGSLQRILPGSRSPPRWRDDQHEDAALRSVIDERLSVSPAAIAAKAYAPRECGQESGSVGVAQCPLRCASDQIVRGCKMTRCAKRRHRLAHSMTASTGAEGWTQRCLKRRCRRAHRRFDR
jgi:hypothetical protein